MLGLAAHRNGSKTPVDPRRKDARRAVGQRIERRLQLLEGLSGREGSRALRAERDDYRKWGQRRVGNRMRPAVDCAAVDAAVEHHHLPVHPVEGSQAEAAMAEQLGDGGITVIVARQQAGDGGNLVDLAGVGGQRGGGEDGERQRAPKLQANHCELRAMGRLRASSAPAE
jgi:hypothetical protein